MPDPTLVLPPDPAGERSTAGPFAAWVEAGAAGPAGPPGFDLLAEVGRGGMGVVYRARDAALGREVAVKLLQDRFPPTGLAARRFLDEAAITGQLQHPGIPAVHQVGHLADGRPFLVMKLVRGRTLGDPAADRPPVPAVFEGLCQAVGYAHAHGVIHRDLKPGNVMVGAFGEVQVMDWGLAKVLAGGADPAADPEATDPATAVRADRHPADATRDGEVLGTPAYMAPEQAAGAADQMDARTDVFGLGAVLCALLTGKPPYVGANAGSTRLLAARAELSDAFGRLDGCGADPAVVTLCKRCLSADRADRPADAGVVAGAVAALRAAAEERARRAETAAAEGRVRRRLQLRLGGLAAGVLAAGLGGTTIGYLRADRERQAARAAEGAAEERRAEAEAARRAEADQKTVAVAKATEANAIVRFFEERVFAAARPKGQDGGLGKDVSLRDALAASLPALAGGFADQPLVEARLRLVLGITFRHLGDAKAAVAQDERAVAIHSGRLGPDDPDRLDGMNNLAISYAGAGRFPDALRLSEQVLAAHVRVSGPDHPNTLKGTSNLASNYYTAGRLADAVALLEPALDRFDRVFGRDHPDTLRA